MMKGQSGVRPLSPYGCSGSGKVTCALCAVYGSLPYTWCLCGAVCWMSEWSTSGDLSPCSQIRCSL